MCATKKYHVLSNLDLEVTGKLKVRQLRSQTEGSLAKGILGIKLCFSSYLLTIPNVIDLWG